VKSSDRLNISFFTFASGGLGPQELGEQNIPLHSPGGLGLELQQEDSDET
jgi:hypothetical protein